MKYFVGILFSFIFAFIAFCYPTKSFANIDYINTIKERGSMIVGMPPYNNKPYYYKDSPPSVSDSEAMKGSDVDLIRNFANNLGVDVIFDQTSESFNDTVDRAGNGDFDLAIGKLSTNYPRMSKAHPHVYMKFRQALLANRQFLSKFSKTSDKDLGQEIIQSDFKVGFIANSSYERSANNIMKKATKKGYKSWDECIKALSTGQVDAIYRDATEIKKIVYKNPNLSIKYVPVLFEDLEDTISIYLSTDANTAMSEVLNFYLNGENIKTDSQILDEFSDYYKPNS